MWNSDDLTFVVIRLNQVKCFGKNAKCAEAGAGTNKKDEH
jgi:hypothetical protein